KKNPCKVKTNTPIQPPIQMPIQTSIQAPLQAPVQKDSQQHILMTKLKPVKVSSKIPNKDTLFKNPDIEWNYKE
ncbi:5090_t:CDS:1, partial [Funneliformis geosporum]